MKCHYFLKARNAMDVPVEAAVVSLAVLEQAREEREALERTFSEDACDTRDETVFAWLIERGQPERQAPTLWWAEEEDARWGGWTTDAYKAVRFATKAEAEEQIRVLSRPVGEPTMHASEHGFLPPGVLPADEPEREQAQ